MIKKVLKTVTYLIYVLAVALLLLEVAYRYQVIEFYETELNALNRGGKVLEVNNKKTILLSGDSFTAYENNYGELLRDSLTDYRIINSAVVGTSIVETSYLAPKRIKNFDPDIFIYQIYVGNDLMGVRHNLNWNGSSWLRNIYWWLSEKLHVLGYLNYRLGQWHSASSSNIDKVRVDDSLLIEENFSVDRYRPREKLYAREDPFMISDAVLLAHGRDDDMQRLIELFDEIVTRCRPECKIFVLVIPHKAQVNENYFNQMQQIGFRFSNEFGTDDNNYRFVQKLVTYSKWRPNVQVLDALPVIRANDSPSTPLYFQNDEHLNDQGHKVLAKFLLQVINNSEHLAPSFVP